MRYPGLPAARPWHGVARQVRQALAKHARRIVELEHLRGSLEIRARRAMEECDQIKAIFSSVSEPILAVNDYNELIPGQPERRRGAPPGTQHAEKRALANWCSARSWSAC